MWRFECSDVVRLQIPNMASSNVDFYERVKELQEIQHERYVQMSFLLSSVTLHGQDWTGEDL